MFKSLLYKLSKDSDNSTFNLKDELDKNNREIFALDIYRKYIMLLNVYNYKVYFNSTDYLYLINYEGFGNIRVSCSLLLNDGRNLFYECKITSDKLNSWFNFNDFLNSKSEIIKEYYNDLFTFNKELKFEYFLNDKLEIVRDYQRQTRGLDRRLIQNNINNSNSVYNVILNKSI